MNTYGITRDKTEKNEFIDLKGGTSKDDKKALFSKARKKMFSTYLAPALVDAARESGSPTMLKSYWNTYHCNSNLTLGSDGKIYGGRYCGNRWCYQCNSMRTAKLIQDYEPIIKTWTDKWFITLTRPNVEAGELKKEIEYLLNTWKKIQATFKKQYQREQREKLVGFRKLECTYNPKSNTFHPHFHGIIKGERNASEFVEEWLRRNPTATRDAQDIREADDNSCIELFKYFTKMITTDKSDRKMYADSLNQIFIAMRGKRVFQPIGFRKPKVKAVEDNEEKQVVFSVQDYQWDRKRNDWIATTNRVNYETGEIIEEKNKTRLTNYVPSEGFEELLKDRVVYRKRHTWIKTEKFDYPWPMNEGEIKAGKAKGFDIEGVNKHTHDPHLKIPKSVIENRLLKDKKIVQLTLV